MVPEIDVNSETWRKVEKVVQAHKKVSRDFLESPDQSDHAEMLIHKGRISMAKHILGLPKHTMAVITTAKE